jgi:transcriptional regulator with XRE-family HTH domain
MEPAYGSSAASPLAAVGARIRRARLRHRPPLTLAALAGEALSVGLVSKIERGLVNPSLHTLLYLADRLGVSPAELVSEPTPGYDRPAAALAAARALLLLGDPAGAAALALAVASRSNAGTAQVAVASRSEGKSEPLAGGSHTGPLQEEQPSRAASGEARPAPEEDRPTKEDEAAAADVSDIPATNRARLLGLAAEALLATGDAVAATARLVEASALVAAGDGTAAGAEVQLARAELAWVLGLIERRRGQRAAAERSWARSLDLLEHLPPPAGASPEVQLIHARTLAELGALHEANGALETARHFSTRALAIASALTDPAAVARRLLAGVPLLDHLGTPAAGWTLETAGEVILPAAIAASAVLAVVGAAATLVERIRHDLDRLERQEARHYIQAPPFDVSHSRYLR